MNVAYDKYFRNFLFFGFSPLDLVPITIIHKLWVSILISKCNIELIITFLMQMFA